MKQENNSNNIHVFRVKRVAARIREPPNPTSNPSTTAVTSTSPVLATVNSRTSLSAETKRLICEDHINNPKYTQEALASKYGCKRTTVAKIIKSKDRWLAIDSDAAIAKRFRQRSSRYPLVENALMLWLQKEHGDITVVTDQMLRCQARQYAQAFYVEGLADFKASSSWVSNFKQRYMTPKSNNNSHTLLLENGILSNSSPVEQAAFNSSSSEEIVPVFHVAPQPTVENLNNNESSILPVDNTTNNSTPGLKHLVVNFTLPSKKSTQNLDNHTTATTPNLTQGVVETDCRVKKIPNNNIEESSFIAPVNDNYDCRFDMMDHCGNMDSPCFDNSAEIIITPSPDHNNTHNQFSEQDSDLPKPETATVESNSNTIIRHNNTTHQQQQQENTKLSAKQHLEAALAFYTSQSESSNSSMSANMIKLILQNDF